MAEIPATDHLHVDISLPVEIIDMIIDLLWDDKDALATMSLVCKTFLLSSRKHLFKTVTLRRGPGELPLARLKQLISISVSLAPVVRRLDIIASSKARPDELSKWITAAIPLFAALHGVTCLCIQLMSWIEIEPELRDGVFGSFPHLLELSLHFSKFFDVNDLVRSILRRPSLEGLTFHDVSRQRDSIVADPLPPGSGTQNLSRLQSLDISGIHSPMIPIINWFRSLDTMPSLHTLRIADIASHECEPVGHFVRALGPSLRHLKLTFNDGM
jgi:hypothetical protein